MNAALQIPIGRRLGRDGCLRRWFGLDPSMARSWTVWEPLKVAFARAVKAMGGFKGHKSPPRTITYIVLDLFQSGA